MTGTRATITVGVDGTDEGRRRIDTIGDAMRRVNDISLARLGSQVGSINERIVGLQSTIGNVASYAIAGLSLAGFIGQVNGALDSLGQLDDLSQKIGSSVESLSQLQKVAKAFGVEFGTVDSVLTKFAKGLTGTDEEASKVRKALNALGIEAKDSTGKLRDPVELFVEVSKRLQGYEDGAGKAALANDALGKSGADLLPFMNDVADNIDRFSTVSTKAATDAAAMQDKLGLLRVKSDELATVVGLAAVPAISDLADGIMDVLDAQDDLTKSELPGYFDDLAVGAARVVDVMVTIPRIVSAIAGSFKVVAADLKLLQTIQENSNPVTMIRKLAAGQNPADDIRRALAERNQVLDEANKKYDELWNKPANLFEQAVLKRITERGKPAPPPSSTAGAAPKPTLNYTTGTDTDAKEAEKAEAAYRSLIASIRAKIAVAVIERDTGQAANAVQQERIKLDQEIEAGTRTLTPARREQVDGMLHELEVIHQTIESQKSAAEARKDWEKIVKEYQDTVAKTISDATTEVERNEELARTYGMTAAAIEQAELAQLQAQLAARSENALTLEQIENLERLIALKQRNVAAVVKIEKGESGKKALEDLDKFLDPARAQEFGEALREAFGSAGSAISKVTGALDGFGRRQAEISKQRENASTALASGMLKEEEYAERISRLNEMETKNRLAGYGDMASAAAGFFGEQSKGYQTLMAVSKVFHAAELAMTLAELVPKGISAVLNQANGDPYSAFGRMAAMAALVAGLGVAIGGISGGGSNVAKDRQAAAGTGTVFGDSSAKSESISRSLDRIEQASFQELAISTGMLTSLRNIENNIGNFASLVIETTTLGKPIAAGNRGSSAEFGSSTAGVFATGGVLGVALDKLTGGWVGKITGSVMNRLFGGKKTVEDTGFSMDKIAFADIFHGKLSSYQYADIKKDGGMFGSDKRSTQMEGLGLEGNRQFALVLTSLYDAVFEAGKMLDLNADDFSAKLNAFVVDIGKISLKDMKPDEVQKQLEAVFSKVGDELARFGAGGLERFQQVGEGYLETLTRLATTYKTVTVVAESLGMTFGAVGFQSIEARERLVSLAGGLEKFTSSAEQFMTDFFTEQEQADALRARIKPTLDKFGIRTGEEDSLKQFRNVVLGLDLTTAAGAEAFATLMQIEGAFKRIADVDAAVFEERASLEEKLRSLTMSAAELREYERSKIHANNRALFDQIAAIEDSTAALESEKKARDDAAQAARDAAAAALGSVDGAFSVLQRVVGRQKAAVQEQIALQSELVSKHKALSSTLRSALESMQDPEAEMSQRMSAQAQIKTALAIARAGGVLPDADGMKEAIAALGRDASDQYATQVDYLRDFYTTKNDIAELAGLTDDALSVEERSLAALETEVERLDDILETAQLEIDVLKGIDTSVLSVFQAVRALASAIVAAQANPAVAATSAISQAYQAVLGRAPDAAGLAFWQERAAEGVSTSTIVDAIKNSPEARVQALYQSTLGRSADAGGLQFYMDQVAKGTSYEAIQTNMAGSDEAKAKLPKFDVGTNRVPYDMPAMIHEDERIIPAADNRELMHRLSQPADNNAVLVGAVQQLTTENRQLRQDLNDALYAIAKNTMETKDFLDKWETIGQPTTRAS